MAITQTYNLDLVPNGPDVVVKVSQYDKGSRTIVFNLFKESVPYEVPNGATVTVRGTKADNTGFEYPCTSSGTSCSFDIQEQMTIFNGKVLCEVRIAQSGSILGTANFILFVERTSLADDTVISETDLPLVQKAADVADQLDSIVSTIEKVEPLVPSGDGTAGQYLQKTNSGTQWADVNSAIWGNITGTLSNQTDLNNALSSISNSAVKKVNNVSPTSGNVKINRTRTFTLSSTSAVTYTSPSGKTYTRRYSATGLTGVTANTIANVLNCSDPTVTSVCCVTSANQLYIYFTVTPSTSATVLVEFTESEAL